MLVREDPTNTEGAIISAIACFWRHPLLASKNKLPKSCTVEDDNFVGESWHQVEKVGSEVLFRFCMMIGGNLCVVINVTSRHRFVLFLDPPTLSNGDKIYIGRKMTSYCVK